MPESLDRVQLIGYVGSDPEIHTFQSGDLRVSFSVATSEHWKDDAGNRKERTHWHRAVILNPGLAKVAQEYVRRGSHLMVEGAMEYREWTDQGGAKKQAAEIVLRPYDGRLILLDQSPNP